MRAVDATGVDIGWRRAELNEAIISKPGKTLPQYLLDSLNETHVGLKGPVTTPVAGGLSERQRRAAQRSWICSPTCGPSTLPGIKTRSRTSNIDMVIFRENTEDLYSGLEHEVVKDVVTSLKVITRRASIRIAEYAFDVRAKNRPQESGGDPQGQHHEAGRRPVPALLPRSGRAVSARSSTRN